MLKLFKVRKIATSVCSATLLASALMIGSPQPANAGSFPNPMLDAAKPAVKPVPKQRSTEPTFDIIAGVDGEIFPVFANYASLRRAQNRQWGTVAIKVTNSTAELMRARITVQVPGWSDQEIQIAEVPAGISRTYIFAPTFQQRLYNNREIAAATAVISVTDMAGRMLHSETAPVRLRSVDDMYWGKDFQYAPFIASWVTPHDPKVEQLLSTAKEFMPKRRLPGYETEDAAKQERSTYLQAKAIYRALQKKGVSYVKSSLTFGDHQDVSERVRMPGESLHDASANCIDGAVMYASIFENLGMEPIVLLVPGHAYVGVRVAKGADRFLYLETSLTGRATFEQAVDSAERGLAKFAPNQITRISIRDARFDGIYPMPSAAKRIEAHESSPLAPPTHKTHP